MTTEMSTGVISIVRAGRIAAAAAARAFGASRIVGRGVPRRSLFGDAIVTSFLRQPLVHLNQRRTQTARPSHHALSNAG
jgi:hypothetical protein